MKELLVHLYSIPGLLVDHDHTYGLIFITLLTMELGKNNLFIVLEITNILNVVHFCLGQGRIILTFSLNLEKLPSVHLLPPIQGRDIDRPVNREQLLLT